VSSSTGEAESAITLLTDVRVALQVLPQGHGHWGPEIVEEISGQEQGHLSLDFQKALLPKSPSSKMLR
jgi:hypothetical protein